MLEDFLTTRLGPGSIFFPPYLLCSGLFALFWLKRVEQYGLKDAFDILVLRDQSREPSMRVDWLFSLCFVVALQGPVHEFENAAFMHTLYASEHVLSLLGSAPWELRAPVVFEGVLATLLTMLAIDFSSYAMHRALHRFTPLWRVHAVHHAATGLTPFTTYRQHPLEPVILNGARGVAAAVALACFHWVFVQRTPVVTIYGLGAGFFAYMFTVNLHHASVPVRYPRWLRYVLISPHVHHLHHSADKQHQNCNFGVVFAFWDRAFRTYFERDFSAGELRFGLGEDDPFAHSLRASLLHPVFG